MADFLASFNFGSNAVSIPSSAACASIADLQDRLRAELQTKVTPTRAEHITSSLEISQAAQFTVDVADTENGGLEALVEAIRDGTDGDGAGNPQSQKVVRASDTLMDQPQNNPALQKTVAKRIAEAVGAMDGSAWVVRGVARDGDGWTFTYVCKDSYQYWARQNPKAPSQASVVEYSKKELDPVMLARPAFNCQGTLVISFSRKSRVIVVKYDHTPLHRTVAEMKEYFNPPPKQLGPGALRLQQQLQQQQQKTPKKSSEKKQKTLKTPRPPSDKKKRSAPNEVDENGNPIPRKKAKRKSKAAGADAQTATDGGPVMPLEHPSAIPVDGPSGQNQRYGDGQQSNGAGDQNYPSGLVDDSQNPDSVPLSLNILPEEATRRREAATAMLSEAGVEPATLSADQFNIFANQSPDLQRESLNMLVRYGAERLRIIHPSNREGSVSATPPAAGASASQAGPTGSTTTKELVPQAKATPKKKGSSRKSAGGASTQEGSESTPKSKRPMGKSRVACFSCKLRKVKCPRERPSCSECQTEGFTCEYPPQRPRSKKSEAIVGEDDDEEEVEEDEEAVQGQLQQEQEAEEQRQVDHDMQEEYSPYPQMPLADLLTPSGESRTAAESQTPYFQSASGLALPSANPALMLPQTQSYPGDDGSSSISQQQQQQPIQDASHSHPAPQSKRKKKGARSKLPSNSTNASGRNSSAAGPIASPTDPSWQGVSNPAQAQAWGANARTQSPATAGQTTRRPQAQVSASTGASMSPQMRNAAATLSQASLRYQNQSPQLSTSTADMQQTTTRQSPAQHPAVAHARSNSQQGHIARMRTPMNDRPANKNLRTPVQGNGASRSNDNRDISGLQNYSGIDQAVSYDKYGRQKNTSGTGNVSYNSYDYNRANNPLSNMSMSNQTPTTVGPSQLSNTAQSNRLNQWPTQGGNNYGDPRMFDGQQSSFNQGGTGQSSGSDHGSGRGQQQQQQLQSNWYGMSGGSTNMNQRYDWKMPGQPWSGYN